MLRPLIDGNPKIHSVVVVLLQSMTQLLSPPSTQKRMDWEREREEQVKYRAILGCLQKHKRGKIHLQRSSILKGSIHHRKQTCCVRTGWGVNITIITVSHSIQQLHKERVSWDNIYKTSVNSLWQSLLTSEVAWDHGSCLHCI